MIKIPFFLTEEEDTWFKILNDMFSLEMGQYENLGFGDFAFNNLRGILFGMVLGIIFASYLVIFNRRVHGDFIRSLINEDCSTPAKAKTLAELGYLKNSAVRGALRSGNTYRGIVRCVEAEEYYTAREQARGEYEARVAASGEKAPAFSSPEYHHDFAQSRFYIPEDIHFTATRRFEKKGTGVFTAVAITVVSIILFWAVLKFLPDIMQYIDNFVGIINQ
ncbi:MAG: hypothetical protein IJY97_10005 [Clostridia bacterium]|nr:hypothetical protein [Clostridia bacterium]